MKYQHEKIKGYRNLDDTKIAMINVVKDHEGETNDLLKLVMGFLLDDKAALHNTPDDSVNGLTLEDIQESERCLHIAKQRLQEGYMWFVRGIALPESV